MKTFGWSLLSAGVALIFAFALVIFESGIIADETGSVGALHPGQATVGILGIVLFIAGVVTLIISARRGTTHRRAEAVPS
jgi:hypothetical protein